MNFGKAALFGLLLAIASANANADAPAQWHERVTLKYVYAGQVGGRVAISVNAAINYGTCSPGGEMVLDPNNPHFKTMLVMIMTAYSAERPISVYTNGTCVPTGVLLTDVSLPQ